MVAIIEFIKFLDEMSLGELQDYLEAYWHGEFELTDQEEWHLVERIRQLRQDKVEQYVIVWLVLLAIINIDGDKNTPITNIFNKLSPPELSDEYDLIWETRNDGDVCELCDPLDGKIYGVDFTLRPKLHPNCRCRLKKVKKVRRAMDKIGILQGGAVRAVKDGKKRILEVLAAPFGSPSNKDRLGQFLSPNTNFMIGVGEKRPLLYFHGFSPRGRKIKSPPSIGTAITTKVDDKGLWMRAELNNHELATRTWEAALEGNARASTGSVNYLEDHDKQSGEVYCWPIAELSVFDGGDDRVPVSDDAVVLPLRALFTEHDIDYTFEAGEDKDDSKRANRLEDKKDNEMNEQEVIALMASEKAKEEAKAVEKEAIRAEIKKELEDAAPNYRATFNVNKHTKDKGLPDGELETYNYMADLIQDAKIVASGGQPRNAMRVTTYLEESEADEIGSMVPDDMANKIHALKGKYSLIDRIGIKKYYTDKLTFNIPAEVTAFTTPATIAEAGAYVEILPEFVAKTATMLKKGFKVRVTEEALEDQDLFQQWLTQASAKAFALSENLTLHGYLDATAGTAIGTTDVVTDAEMIAGYFGLDQEYRDGAVWIMNDATLAYVRAMLVATPRAYGEFGFRPYSMGESGEVLFNKPVFTNANWVALVGGATNNEGITFINPNEALAWVERRGMSIFVDPYTERASAGAINFLPSMRFAGVIVNGAAEHSIDLLS